MNTIINFNTLKAALRAESVKTNMIYNVLIVLGTTAVFILSLFFLISASASFDTSTTSKQVISGPVFVLMGAKNLAQFNGRYFSFFLFIIAPFIISIIASSIANIETKNKTLPTLFMQPIKRSDIFLSKVILTLFYLAISSIFIQIINTCAYLYFCGQANMPVNYSINVIGLMFNNAISFVYFSIPIVMVHILLGLRFKIYLLNMMVCMLFSLVSGVYYAFIPIKTTLWYLIYTYPLIYVSQFFDGPNMTMVSFYGLIGLNAGVSIAIGALGYFMFNREKKFN